jgi:hypothetical protein
LSTQPDRLLDDPAASIARQIPPILINGVGIVALARTTEIDLPPVDARLMANPV